MNFVYVAVARHARVVLPLRLACVAGLFLALMSGCIGRADPGQTDAPPVAAPDASPTWMYSVEHCAIYTGRDASLALRCDDGYYASAVTCDAVGGTVVRRSHGGGLYWECQAFWSDPSTGGTLCEYMTCSHVTSSDPG